MGHGESSERLLALVDRMKNNQRETLCHDVRNDANFEHPHPCGSSLSLQPSGDLQDTLSSVSCRPPRGQDVCSDSSPMSLPPPVRVGAELPHTPGLLPSPGGSSGRKTTAAVVETGWLFSLWSVSGRSQCPRC